MTTDFQPPCIAITDEIPVGGGLSILWYEQRDHEAAACVQPYLWGAPAGPPRVFRGPEWPLAMAVSELWN